MVVGDAYVFPGFLTPVLTQLFFPKPLTTFLTCFYRGERRKYAGKKSRLSRGSNSQPPGDESDKLTSEPYCQMLHQIWPKWETGRKRTDARYAPWRLFRGNNNSKGQVQEKSSAVENIQECCVGLEVRASIS